MLGIPFLLGAIVLAKRLAPDRERHGIWAVVLTLGVLGWTTAARIMRSAVIASKNQDYVAAARMLGAGTGAADVPAHPAELDRAVHRGADHRCWASTSPPRPRCRSWASGCRATRSVLGHRRSPRPGPYVRTAAGPLVLPSVFLALTVLAFIMLGDAVRDAFDPKLR